MISKFTQIVTNAKQGNLKGSALIDMVQKGIKTSKNILKTEATTKINAFKQIAANTFASIKGIERYMYVNPLDAKTRQFCKQHTGEIKTLKEWDELDNGQINPVSVYVGGYNCRGRLVGVS